jgi:lipopolysaccharide export system ATP-binding protein
MPSLLEIDSVIKAFDNRQVLTDIYLKCQTGDIIGMLGRNGSGKSTLLQIIFGTLTAEKFIRIDGKVYEHPFKTLNQICYLPQHEFLPKQMTVEKVVKLYLDKNEINKFLDDDLLQSHRQNKIYFLSGGELRYLEIKLLLNTKSKFVLLDEPFNGVAPIMVETIKKLIKSKSQTKGIILTDHDYRNVLDVANKYCLIYDGGIKEVTEKLDLVKWGYISETKL